MSGASTHPSRPARVGVVVVNYRSRTLLRGALEPLDAPDVRIYVVDNFSTADEASAVRTMGAERGWTVINLASNVGFGAAVNIGAAAALTDCDVLLVLNPDARIELGVVLALRDACVARPLELVTPKILRTDGSVWFRGGSIALEDGGLRPPLPAGAPADDRRRPWLTGACLFVHRELWNRVGGFDEDYFLYWEDVDLSFRCLEAGGTLAVRADLIATHDVGGTQHESSARAKSSLYYRYNCRNRLVFAAKHLSRRDQWRWIIRTPIDCRRVVLRGGRRQLLHPGRCVGPAVAGAVAGLAWLAREALR